MEWTLGDCREEVATAEGINKDEQDDLGAIVNPPWGFPRPTCMGSRVVETPNSQEDPVGVHVLRRRLDMPSDGYIHALWSLPNNASGARR